MRVRMVAPLLAGAMVFASLDVGPAAGDSIGDKRAQAAQIADQLDQLNARGEALAERYNATAQAAADLATKLGVTQTEIDRNQAAYGAAKSQMRSWALQVYVHAGNGDPLMAVIGSSVRELNALSVQQSYASLAVAKSQQLADGIAVRRDASRRLAAQLRDEQVAQQRLHAQLIVDKTSVEQAIASEKAVLNGVQGELKVLVDQEQLLRAAAAEQAVKARLSAEAAARKAAADRLAADAAAQKAAADKLAADAGARKAAAARQATSTTRSPTSTARPTDTVGQPPTTTRLGIFPAGPRPGTSVPGTNLPGKGAGSSSTSSRNDPPSATGSVTAGTGGTSSGGSGSALIDLTPGNLPAPPAPSPFAAAVVSKALSQLGVPYLWGAASPGVAFDCSGLTSWAWSQAGRRDLPHNAAAQFAMLPKVPIDQLQPGDLVFFGADLHHVGLYIGNGQMVNAPYGGSTVSVASIYRRDLVSVGGRP